MEVTIIAKQVFEKDQIRQNNNKIQLKDEKEEKSPNNQK